MHHLRTLQCRVNSFSRNRLLRATDRVGDSESIETKTKLSFGIFMGQKKDQPYGLMYYVDQLK